MIDVLRLQYGKKDTAAAREALAIDERKFVHDRVHLQGAVRIIELKDNNNSNNSNENATNSVYSHFGVKAPRLAAHFLRFARGDSKHGLNTSANNGFPLSRTPKSHSQGGSNSPLFNEEIMGWDIRYFELDGQALHIFPLVVTKEFLSHSSPAKNVCPLDLAPASKIKMESTDDAASKGNTVISMLNGVTLEDLKGSTHSVPVVDAKKQVKRLSMVGVAVECDEATNRITLTFVDHGLSLCFEPLTTNSGTLADWRDRLRRAASTNFKNDYKVISRIGEGAYAKVFLCQDRTTLEEFAVKVLNFDVHDEKSRIYMRREISILALLDEHPNIVTIRDVYEEPDRIYFVMARLKSDLYNYLQQKGALDERRARLVFIQILRGLHHLHQAGITHRDIKPKNIVMDSLASVKITDFGSARALETTYIGASTGLTKSAAGSGGFLAPEIISGKEYGRKCDLWSAGVVLYYMLTVSLPFEGMSEALTYAAIMRGKFSMSGGIWESISDTCKDLITCLLQLDVNKRMRADEALQHPWILQCTDLDRIVT